MIFQMLRRRRVTIARLLVTCCALTIALAVLPVAAQEPEPLPTPPYEVAEEDDAAAAATAPELLDANGESVAEGVVPAEAISAEAVPVEAIPVEAEAGTRLLLPVIGANSRLASQPPSALPQVVNGNFDDAGGWAELQNGAPTPLIYPTATFPTVPVALPTAPRLAWLGGTLIFGSVVSHQLQQSITLPADYDTALLWDFYTQSAEPACGVDTAGLYVNGNLVDGNLPLCAGQSSDAWSERATSLRAFRGQTVLIEFRLVANDSLNSNLYVDNVELCGSHSGLPVARQCQPAGWQEVGGGAARSTGISAGLRNGRLPAVAISSDGRPWAAWQGTSGGRPEIFAKRWNGVAWEAVGGSASGGGVSNTSGISAEPSLAIVPPTATNPVTKAMIGMPCIAWHDFSAGAGEIYVRCWNGSAWVEIGGASASGGGVSSNSGESYEASLAIAPNGDLWLAWTNAPSSGGNGVTEIYVKRFDGTAWVEVGAGSASGGGISDNSGNSDEPALAVGDDGSVFVAWADESGGDAEIYARRWTGSAWVQVGANSATGGGLSNNNESSRSPALVVTSVNRAFVAWVDRSGGDTEIYALQWNGAAWLEAGANSASGGGISNNSGDSLDVSLGMGRNGTPVAAWTDLTGGAGAEIYVRRWDGSAWLAVGASAGGGGISANAAFSSEPAAAVAPDGTPYVLWANAASNGSAIYARRYSTK